MNLWRPPARRPVIERGKHHAAAQPVGGIPDPEGPQPEVNPDDGAVGKEVVEMKTVLTGKKAGHGPIATRT